MTIREPVLPPREELPANGPPRPHEHAKPGGLESGHNEPGLVESNILVPPEHAPTTMNHNQNESGGTGFKDSEQLPVPIQNVVRTMIWTDEFYANDKDVLAVFDIDRAHAAEYIAECDCFMHICACVCCPCLMPCVIAATMDDKCNKHKHAQNMHVGVKRDGIAYQDQRGTNKFIPFISITSVKIFKRGCRIEYFGTREQAAYIHSLKDPQGFRDLLQAMAPQVQPQVEFMERGSATVHEKTTTAETLQEEVARLRQENAELKEQNEMLRGPTSL